MMMKQLMNAHTYVHTYILEVAVTGQAHAMGDLECVISLTH